MGILEVTFWIFILECVTLYHFPTSFPCAETLNEEMAVGEGNAEADGSLLRGDSDALEDTCEASYQSVSSYPLQ